MTQNEIIRMAREAGFPVDEHGYNTKRIERFAALVAAHERETCAMVCEEFRNSCTTLFADIAATKCAAAIRAIKFEGDTGFRPVSEMVAEHKQDPEKGAAIEKAKMRKATRAEKIVRPGMYKVPAEQAEQEPVACPHGVDDGACKECYMEQTDYFDYGLEEVEDYLRNCCSNNFMADKLSDIRKSLYTHPVRTKDLTDAFINELHKDAQDPISFARAVIAADRKKNNANNNT